MIIILINRKITFLRNSKISNLSARNIHPAQIAIPLKKPEEQHALPASQHYFDDAQNDPRNVIMTSRGAP